MIFFSMKHINIYNFLYYLCSKNKKEYFIKDKEYEKNDLHDVYAAGGSIHIGIVCRR